MIRQLWLYGRIGLMAMHQATLLFIGRCLLWYFGHPWACTKAEFLYRIERRNSAYGADG